MTAKIHSNGRYMEWTPENIAALARLWGEGKSGAAVARALAEEGFPARTRSSIMGKVHRLGLPERLTKQCAPRKVRQRPDRRSHNGVRVKQNCATPLPAPPVLVSQWVHFNALSLSRQCRDVTEHNARTRESWHCGAPVVPGTCWCAGHLARYSMPYQPKQAAA